jgi:hypothetical protein
MRERAWEKIPRKLYRPWRMRSPNTRATRPDDKTIIPRPPVQRLPGKPPAGVWVTVGTTGWGVGMGDAVLVKVGSGVPKISWERGIVGVTTVWVGVAEGVTGVGLRVGVGVGVGV